MRIKIIGFINCIRDAEAEDIFNLALVANKIDRKVRLIRTNTAESGMAPVVFESDGDPTDRQLAIALCDCVFENHPEIELDENHDYWFDTETMPIPQDYEEMN